MGELSEVKTSKTNQQAFLDKSNFHLYRYRGSNLLYDITTGTICELNELAYDCLNAFSEFDFDQGLHHLQKKYPGLTREYIDQCLSPLMEKDFFKPPPYPREIQKKRLDVLWSHKSRGIQFFVSQACNMLCRYCYAEAQGSNAENRLMSWDVAKASVDHLVNGSGKRNNLSITFFGGEPLLNFPVIKRIVDYCHTIEREKGKKFTYSISTNGTLLNREVRQFLFDNNFSMLVSLDGFEEMHNWQRPSQRGNGTYKLILENSKEMLKIFKTRNEAWRIKMRSNLTSRYHDIEKVVGSLEKEEFTVIGISAARKPWVNEGKTRIADQVADTLLSDDDFKELDAYYEKIIDESLERLEKGEDLTPYAKRWVFKTINYSRKVTSTHGLRCGVGRNTNAVDAKGNIYPCHRYVGMDKFIIGDVFHGLDHDKTMHYYKMCNLSAIENCQSCWARFICGGGCPWERILDNGITGFMDPRDCKSVRRSLERGMWLNQKIKYYYPEVYNRLFQHKKELEITIDFDD
jgi:uncharacterized protein